MTAPEEKAGQIGKCPCGEHLRIPGQIIKKKPAPPVPVSGRNPAMLTEAGPSVSRKSGKSFWIVLPLVGFSCIAIGAVAVLLLTKGGREEPKQGDRVGNAVPAPGQQPQPTAPAVDPDQKKILECVEGWLDGQKRGDMGAIYWDNFDRMTSLFAVRFWEILLDKGPHPITVFEFEGRPSALVKVRIDSSTRGGMPVSKIWTLSMRKTENEWKINSMYGQNPGDD